MISDVKHPVVGWLERVPLFIAFIVLYVAVDVASFIHPLHDLNITPWNPAPALGLVLVLRLGRVAWLPLAVAVLLSELAVRGVSAAPLASILSALILAGGYVFLATLLASHLPRDTLLDDRRSLFTWLIVVVAGLLVVTCVYLFTLRAVGLLPKSGWWVGVERFWVGDAVGISVLIPYVGAAVVTLPIAVVAYFQWGFNSDFAYVIIAYAIIQFFDGNLLVPLLFAEMVNLHPTAIITAVLFFGAVWGIWGVFFAIPLATLIHAVINAWPRNTQIPRPL